MSELRHTRQRDALGALQVLGSPPCPASLPLCLRPPAGGHTAKGGFSRALTPFLCWVLLRVAIVRHHQTWRCEAQCSVPSAQNTSFSLVWHSVQFSSVQSLRCVRLFATPWTAAPQASPSITHSRSLLKLMPIESVVPSNHLILYRPLLLPPSIFPSIRLFSSELILHIRWPQYWSFSFNINPLSEYSGLISFRVDWLDLLMFNTHSSVDSVWGTVPPSPSVLPSVSMYFHQPCHLLPTVLCSSTAP